MKLSDLEQAPLFIGGGNETAGKLSERNVLSPLDADQAIKDFKSFSITIKTIETELNSIIIGTDAESTTVANYLVGAKRLLKELDEKRKEVIKQPDKFVRAVNKAVRVYKKQLEKIVSTAGEKIAFYETEKRKAQEKAIEKVEDDLKPILPEKTKIETAGGGSVTIDYDNWHYILIDITQVPIEYMTLDEKKIKKAIDAGVRKIPGLDICKVGGLTSRT
jgi:hypothetical protein